MNNDFKPIIEQAEKAESIDEKVDCILTFLKVLSNHIPSTDARVRRVERLVYVFGGAILLALLGTNQITLDFVLRLFRLF